jgi:hypothetical protein
MARLAAVVSKLGGHEGLAVMMAPREAQEDTEKLVESYTGLLLNMVTSRRLAARLAQRSHGDCSGPCH